MQANESPNPYEPPREDCSRPEPDVVEAHVLFERDLVDADRTLPGPIVWTFWLCGGATLGIFTGASVQWIDEELLNVLAGVGLLMGFVGGGLHVLVRRSFVRRLPASH